VFILTYVHDKPGRFADRVTEVGAFADGHYDPGRQTFYYENR
jgi:hypothetical protein